MKRLIFLFILVTIAGYHFYRSNEFQAMLRGLSQVQIDQARIAASRTSLGYVLREKQWVEFSLPKNIDRLKFVTQATVPAALAVEGATFTYGVEYQIIGDNDAPLYHNIYHHTTRVSRFIDEGSEKPYTASMYLDPELIPADGRVLVLNSRSWAGDTEAKSIRIRLRGPQQGLSDALLRTYQLLHSEVPEDLTAWQRLSIYRRERLARGNVYPHGFLSDQEKSILLSNRWEPLGPLGIAGVDYDVRRLYTLKEVSDTPWVWQEQEVAPDIAADRVMTFSTADTGGWLRVSFTRLPGFEYQDNEVAEMNWYGSSINERDRKLLAMSAEPKTITTVGFTPGLLELRAQSPYLVDFEKQDGEEWIHWRPLRLYAPTHLCTSEDQLEFKIAHHNTATTPLRVTLRAPLDVSDSDDLTISYELLGPTAITNTLTVSTTPSLYDRITSRGEEKKVSEPSVFYLQVPVPFTAIRFTSSRPILVSVATRSPELVHQTRVPVDVSSHSRSDPERLSAWFSIRPADYQQRYKTQKTRLVFIQQRPPVDDPDLLLGNYLYESLRPSSNWSGRHLLLPPDPKTPLRAPNPQSVYHPLLPGSAAVQLHSSNPLRILSPSLIYINKNRTPAALRISVDGEHYFSSRLFGSTGKVQLPPLAIGPHRMKISINADVQLLMNYLKRAEPGHILRFATHLPEKQVHFDYTKTREDRDRLSFLYFSSSTSEPSTIQVTLEDAHGAEHLVVHDQFTLTNRRFEISPTETAPVIVFNSGETRLGGGQRFFFPIGADIPPGSYRIVVNLEQGPGGYLIFSRVEPGTFSYRTLVKEPLVLERRNEPSS
ncbi:MAG: hypothetical protein KJN87_09815 [Desulfofustis sp.]|nr:hypothetical protein [Desulfofustis sp.]